MGSYFGRFLEAYPEYDQVRLLDSKGQEQLNIKREAHAIRTIPVHQLQDKSERYYVQEALAQPYSATYISRIDLNREFGDVQRPLRPTVRMVRAVEVEPRIQFAVEGLDEPEVNGLVVVNLSVTGLLQRFRRSLNNIWQTDVFITDESGYFIVHPDPELQWGFDLGVVSNRLDSFFPHVWHQFQSGKSLVKVPPAEQSPWSLKGYRRGSYFISYAFQLPGTASGAGDQPSAAHRYRAVMFVANQTLEPWSLRYHWVWWAFLLFLLTLVVAAMVWAYGAYRSQKKQAWAVAELGLEQKRAKQLQDKVAAMAILQAELRQILRRIRNHAASVIGFSELIKSRSDGSSPTEMADNLQIIADGASQLLEDVDEAQHILAEQPRR